jgi:hypothetical protein
MTDDKDPLVHAVQSIAHGIETMAKPLPVRVDVAHDVFPKLVGALSQRRESAPGSFSLLDLLGRAPR